MKLSSQTMMIVGGVVAVVVIAIVVFFMVKKEKFVSGQLMVSTTSDSNYLLSNQTNVMTFINYVHKIAPGLSISFPPNADNSITGGYTGKLELVIPGVPVKSVLIGKNSFFWADATDQVDRMISQAMA
jgi:hypothetical protein